MKHLVLSLRMKLQMILCLFLCLGLTGCSSGPSAMIFSPLKVASITNVYQGQTFKVHVSDNRAEKHLLKVIDSEGNKSRHPSARAVERKLLENFSSGFSGQGLTINPHAGATIKLSIMQMETVVAQASFKYEAALSVEFKVTITRNSKTFYKTFTGHTSREGILKFDIARLEQDLNLLVTKVMGDIFNDDYIQQSIQA
jgi:uncharacterized lipoprotein YajG